LRSLRIHRGIGKWSTRKIHFREFRKHGLRVYVQSERVLPNETSGEKQAGQTGKIFLLDGIEIVL